MKEFDAHRQLEAYRKIMEVFPIGPIRCENNWQKDNIKIIAGLTKKGTAYFPNITGMGDKRGIFQKKQIKG